MHHHAKLLSREDAARAALGRFCRIQHDVPGHPGKVLVYGWVDLSKLADELYGPAVPILPSYAAMATDMNSFYIEADAPE